MTAIPRGLGVGHALGDGARERAVDRILGEIGQQRGDAFEVELAGKVAERDRQRETVAAAAKLGGEVVAGRVERARDRRFGAFGGESLDQIGAGEHRLAQERRIVPGARNRVLVAPRFRLLPPCAQPMPESAQSMKPHGATRVGYLSMNTELSQCGERRTRRWNRVSFVSTFRPTMPA